MSFFISVGIVLMSTLILASLQLIPSVFTFFYHYASGKFSHKKADDLALFFVLGVETFTTIFFLSVYTIYNSVFYHFPNIEMHLFPWIMAGIFLILSVIAFFLYFRKSRGTELFVSRSVSRQLITHAKTAKSRTDAFALGLFSGTAELFFTLPLYVIAIVAINSMGYFERPMFSMLFIISSVIPVIVFFMMYRSGYNLAEITRRRVKNKQFFRFMISLGFIMLVFAAINMGIAK